jgi:hypothetical protein
VPTFGQRHKLAFAIGPSDNDQPTTSIRKVDIYAAGHWLTCDDNSAYVPTFAGQLKSTVDGLLNENSAETRRPPFPELSAAENHRKLLAMADAGDNSAYLAFRFLDWGETTDNVSANLFLQEGVALIAFSFWRQEHHAPAELGQVFVAELPERELIRVILDTAWALATGIG